MSSHEGVLSSVNPYLQVPKMLQDSSSRTIHAHFCTIFRVTVVWVYWNKTDILFTRINCTEFDVQMLQYEILYAILHQRPKWKFQPENQTEYVSCCAF